MDLMKPFIQMGGNKYFASWFKLKKTNCRLPISHPLQPQSLHGSMKGPRAVERKLLCLAGKWWKHFLLLQVFEALSTVFYFLQTCTSFRVKGWSEECKKGPRPGNLKILHEEKCDPLVTFQHLSQESFNHIGHTKKWIHWFICTINGLL